MYDDEKALGESPHSHKDQYSYDVHACMRMANSTGNLSYFVILTRVHNVIYVNWMTEVLAYIANSLV